MTLSRITIDPRVCAGKPCIRGLRFPVARLLGLLAAGETRERILAGYPYLEPEDIDEALRYAVLRAEDETAELARHLRAGTTVGVLVDGGRLIVKPQPRVRYTLDELLARCDPSAELTQEDHEWRDAKPIGSELL